MPKLKSLRLLVFVVVVLTLTSEKISVKTILKADLFDIEPENILFDHRGVDFSAQKLYGLGQ